MKFLTHQENIQLQELLKNNTLLKKDNEDFRSALLNNCGLGIICGMISLNTPSTQFVIILYHKLSEVYVTVDDSQKLGLVVFLEYISHFDDNLSSEEKDFIKHVINKCEQQQTSGTQKQQRNKITNLLAQGRKKAPPSTPVQQPIKVDRGVIINYDLEKLVAIFRQQVGYEGAFAFAIAGHDRILENYVIERIRKALKEKTGRDNERLEIRLYRDSIITYEDIECKFLKKYRFEGFTDLFNAQYNPDIVLIIWNYDIPQKIIKPLAEDFWTIISPSVDPFVKRKSRCFVIVWANVGKRPLTGFTALPTPKQFDLKDLLPWFRGQLKILEIGDNMIDYYINRLESQCGNLIGTYQEMNQIIQELQGGSRLYG